MKNHKILRIVVGLFCLSLIIVTSTLSMKSNLYQIDVPYQKPTTLPKESWHILEKSAGKLIIERAIKKSEISDNLDIPSITFAYVNAKIRVFCDGNQVYSFGNNGKKYVGNDSGDSDHFIHLKDTNKDLSFTVRMEFASFTGDDKFLDIPIVKVGSMAGLVNKFKVETSFDGILSIIICCIGLMGLFFTFAFWKSLRAFPLEYLSWSIFVFMVGGAFLLDSKYYDLVIGNSFFLYFVPIIILCSIPPVFHSYVFTNKTLAYNKKVMTTFSVLSCFMIVLNCLAALIPIFSFSHVKLLTNVFIIIFLFFQIAIQVSDAISFSGSFNVSNVLLIFSSFALILDLGINAIPPEGDKIFIYSRPVFFIFFIVQSVYVINDFFNVQVLSARKEMYEDAVSQDVLTGTKTRPAFWKYRSVFEQKTTEEKRKTALILVEIKNLKRINEEFGFDRGDEALRTVGTFLQYHFHAKDIFRFDGPAFAVLMENATEDVLNRKIEDTKDLIKDFNMNSFSKIKLAVAKGFADPSKYKTFDNFVNSVQINLYEEKMKDEN